MKQELVKQELSVWQVKPWWCQPWSILLTGVGVIGGSWLLGQRVWLTVLVALPVLAWMGYFLLIYPRLMQPYLRQGFQEGGEDGEVGEVGEMGK